MYTLRQITGVLRSADGLVRAGANVRIVRETATADGDAFPPSAVAFYTDTAGAVPAGTAVAVPSSGSWAFSLWIDNVLICAFAMGAGASITVAEMMALAGLEAGEDTAQQEFLLDLYAGAQDADDGQVPTANGAGGVTWEDVPEAGIPEPASDGLWARLVDGVGSWLAATTVGQALWTAASAAAARLAIGAAALAGDGVANELMKSDAAGNPVRSGILAGTTDQYGGVALGTNSVSAFSGVALGPNATAAYGSVQLGEGTSQDGGLQFLNYQIVDADGNIPADRMTANLTPATIGAEVAGAAGAAVDAHETTYDHTKLLTPEQEALLAEILADLGYANAGEALTAVGDGSVAFTPAAGLGSNTFTGDQNLNGHAIYGYRVREVTANVSGTYTINLMTGNLFILTVTGDVTITFTSIPAPGAAASVTVILIQDGTGGHDVTFTAVKWDGGIAPDLALPAGQQTDLSFILRDGGLDRRGYVAGLNMAVAA